MSRLLKYTRLSPNSVSQSDLQLPDVPLESDGFLEKPSLSIKKQLTWPKTRAFAFAQTTLNFVWTLLLLLTTLLALLSKEYSRPCVEWHNTDIG